MAVVKMPLEEKSRVKRTGWWIVSLAVFPFVAVAVALAFAVGSVRAVFFRASHGRWPSLYE